MFKVVKSISLPTVIELFSCNEVNSFDLRNSSDFILPTPRTVLSRLDPKICQIVPLEIRKIDSLLELNFSDSTKCY